MKKSILYHVLLISLIQGSLSGVFHSAWNDTVTTVHQGERDTYKAYNTTKIDAEKVGHKIKGDVSGAVIDAKSALNSTQEQISEDEHQTKSEFNKGLVSLKSALNRTNVNFDAYSENVKNKLNKLKVETEKELTKAAATAGNGLEMGISKGVIDYQAKEEAIFQKVTKEERYIFDEENSENNCQEESYIQCVVHRNLTFEEGLKSSCAIKYGCHISLKNKRMRQKLDQAQIGIKSLENQSSQNTENEFKLIKQRDQTSKTQEMAAKNSIEQKFLVRARKIMIDGGCGETCIQKCTATMKEYLTNSCQKCKCKKNLSTETIQIVPMSDTQFGTNFMFLVISAILSFTGIFVKYQRKNEHVDVGDEYIKI